MPFVEENIEQEIEKRRKRDADFRESWDNSREEYRLIGELVSLRKKDDADSSVVSGYGIHR